MKRLRNFSIFLTAVAVMVLASLAFCMPDSAELTPATNRSQQQQLDQLEKETN